MKSLRLKQESLSLCQKVMQKCSGLLEGGRRLHGEELVETEDKPLKPVYMTPSLPPFQS